MAGIQEFIVALRAAGFDLVFMWLLTLSIVYGILSHVGGGLPKSVTARGIISISAAFLILLAASGPAVAGFITKLTSSLVVIGFGLMIAVIFLEIAGVKVGEKGMNIFHEHGRLFGFGLILIVVLIFIGAGGLNIIGFPRVEITGEAVAFALFLAVVLGSVWLLYTESTKKS